MDKPFPRRDNELRYIQSLNNRSWQQIADHMGLPISVIRHRAKQIGLDNSVLMSHRTTAHSCGSRWRVPHGTLTTLPPLPSLQEPMYTPKFD